MTKLSALETAVRKAFAGIIFKKEKEIAELQAEIATLKALPSATEDLRKTAKSIAVNLRGFKWRAQYAGEPMEIDGTNYANSLESALSALPEPSGDWETWCGGWRMRRIK